MFVQTLCHVLEHVSCVEQRRDTIAFSGTLHHANDKSSLKTMFDAYNGCRLGAATVLLVVSIHGQINANDGTIESKFLAYWRLKTSFLFEFRISLAANYLLGILLNLILGLQVLLLLWATMWPWLNTRSLWGKVMRAYSHTTDKLDVVRGRSVPSPSKRGGGRGGRSAKYSAHRVLGSLNPYAASENIRLVLDLVAAKSGIGLAFKCLAAIEVDVQSNWRPQKLSFELGQDDALEVSWEDPLAVVYLAPVPKQLQLHYGISVNFSSGCPCPDDIVAVVGYDESRFYQQVWRSSRPGKVHMNVAEAALTYKESFGGIPRQVYGAQVEVWTIVDGQLVAKAAEFRYLREGEGDSGQSLDDSDGCANPNSKARMNANGTGGAGQGRQEPPRISVAAVNEYARGRLRSGEAARTPAVVTAPAVLGGERQVSVVETPPHSSIASSSSSLNDISLADGNRKHREPPVGAAVSKLESRTRSLTNLVAAKVEARARSLKKARSHGNKLNAGGGGGAARRRADPAGESGHEDEGYTNFAFAEEDMVI